MVQKRRELKIQYKEADFDSEEDFYASLSKSLHKRFYYSETTTKNGFRTIAFSKLTPNQSSEIQREAKEHLPSPKFKSSTSK